MQFGIIPGVEKPVSRLIQGATGITLDNLDFAFRVLDAALDHEINTIDTGRIYGDNENAVGLWMLDRDVRDRVVIIGKGAHHSEYRKRVTPFDIESDIHETLARLQTDYIDIYLLHRDDPAAPVGPIVEVLDRYKRNGAIHAYGGSNWTAARLQAANEYAAEHGLAPFVVSSPHLSLAEEIEPPWDDCTTISGPAYAGERAWYERTQLPVFAWSSLSRGFFSGRFTRATADSYDNELTRRCYFCERNFQRLDRVYELAQAKGLTVPQVALAYVFNLPLDVYALVGAESLEEIEDNIGALGVSLTIPEMEWLDLQRDSR